MGEANSSHDLTLAETARAFLQQYFVVLFTQRGDVHKFYKDSSKLTRQNPDGTVSSASTVQGIKEIFSTEYNFGKVEIINIDAQQSCHDGILVVVTGFLIGEDEKKKSFVQTFFLEKHETQQSLYFLVNDIFRFGIGDTVVDFAPLNEVPEIEVSTLLVEGTQESVQVPNQHAEVKQSELVPNQHAEVKQSGLVPYQHAEVKQSELVPEKVINNGPTDPSRSVDSNGPTLKQVAVSKPASTSSKKPTQELPKMSYASMLAKQSPVSTPVKRPTPVVAVAPSANSYLDKKKVPVAPKAKTPVPQPPPSHRKNNATSAPQKAPLKRAPPSIDNSRDGKSIYVKKLPPHIPVEEVAKAFSKYGPIRKNGIQVRTLEDNFCYGFVEFESLEAAREAIKAGPVWFGSYISYVMEKKSPARGSDKQNGSVKPTSGGDFAQNRVPNNSSIENKRSDELSSRSNGVAAEQKRDIKPAATSNAM